MKNIDTLEAISYELQKLGLSASVEYPDFIQVEDIFLGFSDEGNSFTWNTLNGDFFGEIFSTNPKKVAQDIYNLVGTFEPIPFELTEKGKEATK